MPSFSIPPKNYGSVKDVDRTVPKYRAFRCRACRKDFDTTLNPAPKRVCKYCGNGLWENVRSLTLKEAYDLYAETGVLFLNSDKAEHQKVQAFLAGRPRIVAWLDRKQKRGVLKKWPYRLMRNWLKDV